MVWYIVKTLPDNSITDENGRAFDMQLSRPYDDRLMAEKVAGKENDEIQKSLKACMDAIQQFDEGKHPEGFISRRDAVQMYERRAKRHSGVMEKKQVISLALSGKYIDGIEEFLDQF